MVIKGKFDCRYWGIYPDNFDICEKVINSFCDYFNLTEQQQDEIDATANNTFLEDAKDGLNLENITNTINYYRIRAAIDYVCEKQKLDQQDFDYVVNGMCVYIIYKGENIA